MSEVSSGKNPHVLIIPSWYPKKEGDFGGSFFREQAIAISSHHCQVGVLAPLSYSIREIKEFLVKTSGTEISRDGNIVVLRRKVLAFPRFVPYAALLSFVCVGMSMFEKYIERFGLPDIVHVQSTLYAGVLAHKIKKKYGVPFVLTEHFSDFFDRSTLKSWQIKAAERVFSNASFLIGVSKSFCEALSFNFGHAWNFVPNMVSNLFFMEPSVAHINQKLQGVDLSGKFCFFSASYLVKSKRIDLLINAFFEVLKQEPDVYLLIGGDGPERQKLEFLVEDLGIGDSVLFLGVLSREEIHSCFVLSNAYVLSSKEETFGMVLVESLAMGVPVVATKCGGPESIVGEEDGYLIDKNNKKELINAMIKIKKSSFDRYKISNNCRDRFGEDVVVNKIINIYKTIVGR